MIILQAQHLLIMTRRKVCFFRVHILGRPRFTWGSENLVHEGDCRQRYIAALQAADRRQYQPLLEFVRS